MFRPNNYNRKQPFNQGYQNNQQRPKRSGYSFKMITEGEEKGMPVCSAWRATKQGLMTVYARPYSKSNFHKSEQGNEFVNLFVTIKHPTAGVQKTSGLFNMTTKKLVIKEWGLLGTPNGSGQTRSGKFAKGSLVELKG